MKVTRMPVVNALNLVANSGNTTNGGESILEGQIYKLIGSWGMQL